MGGKGGKGLGRRILDLGECWVGFEGRCALCMSVGKGFIAWFPVLFLVEHSEG